MRISKRFRLPGSKLVRAVTVLGLTAAVLIPAAWPAQAAPVVARDTVRTSHVTDSYFITAHQGDSDIHRCLFVQFYGTLKYTVQDYIYTSGAQTQRRYSNFRATPQQFQLYVKSKCKDGVNKAASGATLTQTWWHTKCSLNASIGVQGLDPTFAITPSCGNVQTGRASSPHDENSALYRQGNSKWLIKWNGVFVRGLGGNPTKTPCAEVKLAATANVGGDDGTIRLDKKICANH